MKTFLNMKVGSLVTTLSNANDPHSFIEEAHSFLVLAIDDGYALCLWHDDGMILSMSNNEFFMSKKYIKIVT